MAEALYWIGWAHEQQGDPAASFPLFVEALAVHGNDVKAAEAAGEGAANFNGMMIDAATTRLFEVVLDRARQCGLID